MRIVRKVFVALSGDKILCGRGKGLRFVPVDQVGRSTNINVFATLKQAKSMLKIKLESMDFKESVMILPVEEIFEFGIIGLDKSLDLCKNTIG